MNDDTTTVDYSQFTQGEAIAAAAVNEALEPMVEAAVKAHLAATGTLLGYLAETAGKLAEDGLTLADFAVLLRGGDL